MTTCYWTITPDTTEQRSTLQAEIQAGLGKKFALRVKEVGECEHTLYDDFDWSIWHSGALFVAKKPGTVEFSSTKRRLHLDKLTSTDRFWWDFPPGALQDELKARLKFRALLPVAKLSLAETIIECLNEDRKIVVRLKVVTSVYNEQTRLFISLLPLRGYEQDSAQAKASLNKILKTKKAYAVKDEISLRKIYLVAGICPAEPKKKHFGIAATEPAEQAVCEMLRPMLAQTRKQVDGIIADTDTEFLHDYRVYLRKSRSLATLTKKVFDPQRFLNLKENYALLASPTNNLRDLDVFLLDEHYYRSLVPESASAGLDELFTLVAKERKNALRRVVNFVRSTQFNKTIAALEAELKRAPDYSTPSSAVPILEIAQQKIYKRYVSIAEAGVAIDDSTPDEEVHEIRKDCKKLRYLMEFFAELFPKSRLNPLVKKLKGLQDILGRFNDVSVQQAFLLPYTDAIKYSNDIVLSVVSLIAVLHHQQIEERKKVSDAMHAFAGEKVLTQFSLLFNR